MFKNDRTRNILLIVLIICMLCLTIVYAVMSDKLNITGTASVSKSEWKIHFDNLKEPIVTGSAEKGNAILNDSKTTLTISDGIFKVPGDKITYIVDVVNEGDIDAKVEVVSTIIGDCTSEDGSDVTKYCDKIKAKLVYSDTNEEVKENDELNKGESKTLKLIITYDENRDLTSVPSSAIILGDITSSITYVMKEKSNSSTPDDSVNTNEYVKENLILWYDAINHGVVSNVWEDLANGNNLELHDVTFYNNYYSFNGTSSYGVTSDVVDYQNSGQLTIEFLDMNGALASNDSISILFESSTDYNSNSSAYYIDYNEFSKDTPLTFAINKYINHPYLRMLNKKNNFGESLLYTIVFDSINSSEPLKIYLNGIKYELLIIDDCPSIYSCSENIDGLIFSNYKFYFGSRAGNKYFAKMNLATFRLYNKALSEDEINNNYNIDKSRYNIE